MREFFRSILQRFRKPAKPKLVRPRIKVDVDERSGRKFEGWDEFLKGQLRQAKTPQERLQKYREALAFRKEKVGY